MNKLVKMTLKGRLKNLDSEFFADGFLFGKILFMERARDPSQEPIKFDRLLPKGNKRVFMGNKLRID